MILNDINKKTYNILKKTKPTQENEENSNSANEKEENKLFGYKETESNIYQYSNKKRKDKLGNPIVKGGKQKITFNNKFEEIIDIESYKEFNKTQEIKSHNVYNNCCLLV